MLILIQHLTKLVLNLSACAEDHGLCPWMNAQNVTQYLTERSLAASADFAVGG
jgi:hypothetical protein